MASSIETTSTTTTLKNNGNAYMSVDTNDAVTFATGGISVSSLNGGQLAGNRNLVINGDMRIDQRNAGASITPTADSTFSVDRLICRVPVASKFSIEQNQNAVTPPVGFINYAGVTSLSAYTVAAGASFALQSKVEGFDFARCAFGTSDAKSITFSFWVRSSLTGTFGGAFLNSAADRSYPYNYTISSADTWEQKTITVTGDTTGTWLTNNAIGLIISFGLGTGADVSGTAGSWVAGTKLNATGATSLLATNAATLYITGVQLEAGSVATPFEHRSYGTELALCQRYYQQLGGTSITALSACAYFTTTIAFAKLTFNPMRANPTLAVDSAGDVLVDVNASSLTASGVSFTNISTSSARIDITTSSTTQGFAGYARVSANKYVTVSSEL